MPNVYELLFDVYCDMDDVQDCNESWCTSGIIPSDTVDDDTIREYNLTTEDELWGDVSSCPNGYFLRVSGFKHGELVREGDEYIYDMSTGFFTEWYQRSGDQWSLIDSPV